MSKGKMDFAKADRTKYSAIGNKEAETKAPDQDYKYTVRVPAEYGKYLNQLAWEKRSSIRAEIMRMIADDIKKNKDVMERAKEAL